MNAQTPLERIDLERIVRDAIVRSGMRVDESAERAIIETGRQGEDVLAAFPCVRQWRARDPDRYLAALAGRG
jgi:hypothetical protein